MHTWLPDAHSEAPTPVSALLSGALLATSFYAILRFYQVAAAALGTGIPRDALLAFGVASLLLASLYVFGQRDVKRLLAYSSVEHMGILALGVSFGAPVALAGVLLHVLAHAAAKGIAFMGAGVFTVKYGTKQMSAMRDGLRLLPWSGPLFLLAIFALSALPAVGPLPQRVPDRRRRLGRGCYVAAALLLVLVTIAFLGLATSVPGCPVDRREYRSRWSRRGHGTAAPRTRRSPGEGGASGLDGRPGACRAGVLRARDPPAGRAHRLITQAAAQLRGAP